MIRKFIEESRFNIYDKKSVITHAVIAGLVSVILRIFLVILDTVFCSRVVHGFYESDLSISSL